MKIAVIFSILLQIAFAGEYSFEMLKKSAMNKSLEMKMYKTDVEIQKTLVQEEKSGYYPTINLSGNSEYSKDLTNYDTGVQSIGDNVISSNTAFANSLSLSLKYMLYDFGSREKKIDIQKSELDIKRFEFCKKRKEIFQKILDLYKNALEDKVYISSFNKILYFHNKLYKSKKRLFRAGEISKSDVTNEAVDIVELENNLKIKEKEYTQTLFELSNISYTHIQKQDTLILFKTKNSIIFKTRSFQNSAEARIVDRQIEEKRKELELLKNALKPTFSLYSNYNLYGSDKNNFNRSLNNIKSNDYKIGVGFRWNLFDGHSSRYKKAKLLLEIEKLKTEKKLLKKEFQTKNEILKNKIDYSNVVKNKNLQQLQNLTKLQKMQERLRKVKKMDLLTFLKYKIESIEKKKSIKLQNIQRAYELKSLEIQNEGVSKCTLR